MLVETDVSMLSNDDCTDCGIVVVNTTDEVADASRPSVPSAMLLDKLFQCEQCDKTFTQVHFTFCRQQKVIHSKLLYPLVGLIS